MVRFVKNGSDATEAAVRLARAYTGKKIIIVCGYQWNARLVYWFKQSIIKAYLMK